MSTLHAYTYGIEDYTVRTVLDQVINYCNTLQDQIGELERKIQKLENDE